MSAIIESIFKSELIIACWKVNIYLYAMNELLYFESLMLQHGHLERSTIL